MSESEVRAESNGYLIRTENLWKTYEMGAEKIHALAGVSFVVRKNVKAHGRQKLIEGNFRKGNLVVVIDDVITTGGSTLQAIEAVKDAGGRVAFVLVLVDREEGGREAIEKHGHKVVALFTRSDLVGANAGVRSRIAVA
jgi:orotate phosphoribosyltransferase